MEYSHKYDYFIVYTIYPKQTWIRIQQRSRRINFVIYLDLEAIIILNDKIC